MGTSTFKYATPGYDGPVFVKSENHRVVNQGESSSYAKTRSNLEEFKRDIKKQQVRYSSVLKKDMPVIPNRLNNHANSMRAISKFE